MTEQAPARQVGIVEKIFIGRYGLRAGWSLAIFAAIAVLLGWLGSRIPYPRVRPAAGLLPPQAAFGELVPAIAVLLATIAMSWLEGRSLARYGFHRSVLGKMFWKGAAWGLVALTLLLLLIHAAGDFSFGGLALHGPAVAGYLAIWLLIFFLVACTEEFTFRGYPLYTLARGIGFWPAAIVLSVLFGSGHIRNPGEDWVGALSAGLIGLFFCFTVRRTGAIWFAVGLHALWDFSESYLYSVPDSGLMAQGHLLNPSFHGSKWITGGSVGPEGSLLVLPLIGLLFLVFALRYRKAVWPDFQRPVRLQPGPGPQP
jgi:membrane protease YdiL (CAAX protease family)